MRATLIRILIVSLLIGAPLGVVLADFAPGLAPALVCPSGYDRIQIVSVSDGRRRGSAISPGLGGEPINASMYCTTADTLQACISGDAACRRLPVSALKGYAAVFLVGWLIALLPVALVTWIRRRARRA